MSAYDAVAAANHLAEAHRERRPFVNLPAHLSPPTVADGYAVQEALRDIWTPLYGPVAGLKIATTTKVMQALMGIDHPCGGMIFAKRIYPSGAALRLDDYLHLVMEAELAVRVSRTLDRAAAPYTAATVRHAVGQVMPAFELIEDRNAHYKTTKAYSLIADNAWNGGIVTGNGVVVPAAMDLNRLPGRLTINGAMKGEGLTDDPMGALAWCANLAAERGRPLEKGQVVITGSVVATFAVAKGDRLAFEIEGLGKVEAAIA